VKRVFWLLTLIVMLSLAQGVAADDTAKPSRGTKDQVVALVKKAVEYFKANGSEKAFAAFNDRHGMFIDRDLYIHAYDPNGTCMAHGFINKLVGMNRMDEQDAAGRYYIQERMALMKTHTSFWQDYMFSDPISHKLQSKSTYCETTPDPVLKKVLICAGVYNVTE